MTYLTKNPVYLPDAKILSNTSVSGAGTTSPVDTTNFQSVIVQISGSAVFETVVEGSNDQNYWQTLMSLNTSDIQLNDNINIDGIYALSTTTKYIRLNYSLCIGTCQVVIVGRSGPSIRGADRISTALDEGNNVQLNVKVQNFPKTDKAGASLISDCVGPIIFNSSSASQPLVIDTTGYNSVVVQATTAGVVIPTVSNDGVTYFGTTVIGATTGASQQTSFNIAGIYIIPVTARYIKFTGPASVVLAYIYLRIAPYDPRSGISAAPTNITQVASTNIVTAGVAGIQAVGGNIAAGVAPTANPLLVAGIDTSGLTRRILTDTSGRLFIATVGSVDQANVARNLPIFSTSYQNQPVLPVTDFSQHEGATTVQLLSQILLELQINNFYISQLPWMLQTGQVFSDEPAAFRQEQSLFNV